MARQGWLDPVRLPGGAGYRLTPRAVQRLAQAAGRIYRRDVPAWDGSWHIAVVERVTDRARRDRLRSALGYLGYACLDGSTWISPRPSVELDQALASEQVEAERFTARYDGDAHSLATRAWDLDEIAQAYRRWIFLAGQILKRGGDQQPDDVVFSVRSELVHEWRKFLFVDPGLPRELLPADWPGTLAAELFHREADRLMPAAGRFVDATLAAGNGRRSSPAARPDPAQVSPI